MYVVTCLYILEGPVHVSGVDYNKTNLFVYLKEWIMEQWEKNYYISAIAGATNGSSLVVMSKGLTECSKLVFLVHFSLCIRISFLLD